MKKVFLFLTLAVLLTGCSTSSTLTNFLAAHKFKETHTLNPLTGQTRIHATIDSLYDYRKVAEVCDTADICFSISRGRITVDADCTNGGESLAAILKKLLARIDFLK